MKPAPFEYLAAGSTREAIEVLAADDDAKIIAGGQSLMPLLAMRLAHPTVLVDINDLDLRDLSVDVGDGDAGRRPVLRIGALVRHRRLELDPLVAHDVPVLADAARLIGHPAIRNRGTIGGSMAHADPAAELPAALVALSGSLLVEGRHGTREIEAADFFSGFLTTELGRDEILVEIRAPVVRDGWAGGAFCEWAPASADFAEVGIAVTLKVGPGAVCTSVGAAACGIGTVPVPLGDAIGSAGVVGAGSGDLSGELLRSLAAAVTSACSAGSAGSAGSARDQDRAALAGLLAARAVVRAHAQATARMRAAA